MDAFHKIVIKNLKLNRNISNIKSVYELGHSYFEHDGPEDQPYIKVMSLNQDDCNNLMYKIKEGKFPSNQNEIAISEKVLKASNYKVGDTINLNLGARTTNDGFKLNENNPTLEENKEYLDNTKNRTFKIVGIVSKYGTNHMYYGITTQEKTDNIDAYIAYGTVLGILGAYAIHQAFNVKTETAFGLPYLAIIISIIFVFALVYIIMKYSINKVNKQNTIETIRKENV